MIKNISLRIEEELHYKIKLQATKERKSISEYIVEIIIKDLELKEKEVKQ